MDVNDARKTGRRVSAEPTEDVPPPPETEAKPTGTGAHPPALDLSSRWVTFSKEELEADPPEKEFIWEGRIPLGDVGVLAAQGGAGKTALLTGLAIHRAIRRVFLDRPVRPGTTVLVTAEDAKDDYRRKIAAWKAQIPDLDLDAVARHVHLLDLAGVAFKLIRSDRGDYVPTEHVEGLIRAVEKNAPDADLIVVETVSRVGGDEGNAALSALVCAAETIAKRTGASVLLVAHVSQEAARRNIGDAYAPRGGTAIGANGRYTITLTGLADEVAKELLPGIALSPSLQAELSVLRVPKINSAPREKKPTILQTVPTHWGLTLRVYEPGRAQDPKEHKHDVRKGRGEQLRAMAERFADLGDPLTSSKLSAGLYKQIAGLAKDGVHAAVADAVEDDFVHYMGRKEYVETHPNAVIDARGGGSVLLPGPGEKFEASA